MIMTDSHVCDRLDSEGRFATINVVSEQRHLGRFQFPATSTWVRARPAPARSPASAAPANGTPGRRAGRSTPIICWRRPAPTMGAGQRPREVPRVGTGATDDELFHRNGDRDAHQDRL